MNVKKVWMLEIQSNSIQITRWITIHKPIHNHSFVGTLTKQMIVEKRLFCRFIEPCKVYKLWVLHSQCIWLWKYLHHKKMKQNWKPAPQQFPFIWYKIYFPIRLSISSCHNVIEYIILKFFLKSNPNPKKTIY